MATLNLSINHPHADGPTRLVSAGNARNTAIMLSNYFRALAARHELATVEVQSSASDPVAASATITLASCATDTVTIGGITFTGTASPTTELHFETDGTDTADAAALAAAVNAHTTLSLVVSATSALGVVTVTSLVKGVVGNFITLAETGSTITISAGALAGGTGGPTGVVTSFSY